MPNTDISEPSNVHILYTNICSLRHKINDLEWELQQVPDTIAFCLTETHLGSVISSGELNISNYQLFRKDRDIYGGGVAVYIRSDIQTNVITLQSGSESLLVKLTCSTFSFYLLVVYRPPNNQEPLLLPTLLEEADSIAGDKNLLICGDFNLPKIDWSNYISKGDKKMVAPFLSKLSELCYEQHVFGATHNKGNILDLVLSNKCFVQNVQISPPHLSDHSLIDVQLNIRHKTSVPCETKVYLYNKADIEKASGIFAGYESTINRGIEQDKPINEVYSLFCEGILDIRNQCVPTKESRLSSQPLWFTKHLKNALKKQKGCYNKMIKYRTDYYVNRYRTVKRQNKRLIKQAKKSYMSKRLYKPLLSGDSKPFYRHLKQSQENGCDIMPYLTLNDSTAETPETKANMLNSFF